MQSPQPRVAPAAPAPATVAFASVSAQDTASALEALLEIKNSPPSAFGTPVLQVPTPTTAQQLGTASTTSSMANLQIPTTIPVTGTDITSRPTPMLQTATSAMLPSHLLAPRHYRHREISVPTSAVTIYNHPTRATHTNISGVLVSPGAKALHSTVNSPVPSSHLPNAGMAAVSPPTAKSPTSTSSVREEEIKAALTSKPQRGKKRDNLTAEERKELTKTRNREHARTTRCVSSYLIFILYSRCDRRLHLIDEWQDLTRIFKQHFYTHRMRKKARNDELLAIEAKYQELMQKEKLDQARRACIKEFFAIRTEMLAKALSPPSTDDTNHPMEVHVCRPSSLDKVIENQWLFEVSTLTPKRNAENGIAPLCKFDEVMANSTKSKYPAPNVTYNFGIDSIAIVNDTAIALADIIDQPTQELIVTLTFQFKFCAGLSKIRSLSWSLSSSEIVGEQILGTHHPQSEQQQDERPVTLPSIVSMHSVSSLDRTSPIHGVTTDDCKLSE